jgi:ubiquinone/menaquinone biosynthesis C-methylase UbiE
MIEAARGTLAPVYAPLADHIVARFSLEKKQGIGIDIGGGPGTLVLELAKRSPRMYWITTDINPHFFPYFMEAAQSAGLGHRVGVLFADAHVLPFRDAYADIVVSRGSFHFWKDKSLAFAEIWRVLRPGGAAFVGRGFSENLPVEVARSVRSRQGSGPPKYDVGDTKRELEEIMKKLGISTFRIHIPQPPGGKGVKYGIWLEIRKPAERARG